MVRGRTLNSASRTRHVGFDRGGTVSTGKLRLVKQKVRFMSPDSPCLSKNISARATTTAYLFFFRLVSRHHGNRHEFFVNATVQFQGIHDHFVRFFKRGVRRMAFLPQEFTCTQKGRGVLEFPTHHIGPLIELEGQVTMRLNPVGIGGVPVCGGNDTKQVEFISQQSKDISL